VECVICFEGVAERATLPCACTVDYCFRCWDRSLAESFRNSGQAKCPTCRDPVRVDLDSETGRLVFSRATGRSDMRGDVERLALQSMPFQVRLLQRYGMDRAELQETSQGRLGDVPAQELRRYIEAFAGECDADEAGLLERLRDAAGSWAAVASYRASLAADGPRCVCGGVLQRCSAADRFVRWLERSVPPGQHAARIAAMVETDTTNIVCDICERKVGATDCVWWCKSGVSTILHAWSFDVCDTCFAQHALGSESRPLARSLVWLGDA